METTTRWLVDKAVEKLEIHPHIQQAARLLQADNVVAFPTETVYGLGGNAFSDKAVHQIFKAKGRPADNPLIVHISDNHQLNDLCGEVPEVAHHLMERFWPGPLTLVLPAKPKQLSTKVTAGLSTVGIRMPDNEAALALIRASGLPLAAPSANRSGKPSPTTADHVLADLDGKIAGVIDAGPTGVGVESTVVDCSSEGELTLLRPGGVSKEELETVAGMVAEDPSITLDVDKPKSPGMKYQHYAPEAPMYVVFGGSQRMKAVISDAKSTGQRVGVLATEEHCMEYEQADFVVNLGSQGNPETIARTLYHAIRTCNEHSLDVIYAEAVLTEGIGSAVMNRLLKAAGHRVIK